VRELQTRIAQTADGLGLHATAPTLTLGLLTDVGRLANEALAGTSFGRRPFRPTDAWAQRLADVAFTIINLADQTGIDLEQALYAALARYEANMPAAPVDDLPF
jgi:NTP pyrophosphatase (non-canonical NTP hydrolase)